MDSYIMVNGNGRTVEVTADIDGTINEDTLRGAFQLEQDVSIGLFRDNRALKRRREGTDYLYELKEGWNGEMFELKWNEEGRTRPVPLAVEQGPSKPKRKRMETEWEELPVDGELAAQIGKYALFYTREDNYKRSAIPLTMRLAATFRHGENKSIKIGDGIVLQSWLDKEFRASTRAVKILEEHDAIILQSDDVDLCDKDLIFDSIEPRKGMRYLLMGYAIVHGRTNHQSFCTGVIASDITRRLGYTGTSGSFKGDSGGSCWNESGNLIGMKIEVEKVRHAKDDKGRPASPASGGRCCLISMRSILENIQNLLPQDSDADWDE